MSEHKSADQNRPVLDKDGATGEWLLKVDGAPLIRIPSDQRGLANSIWNSATWAYHNGRRDVQKDIKDALGITT